MTPLRNLALTLRRPTSATRAAVLAAAMLTLAACGGATPESGQVTQGPADGDAVKVVTRDDVFEPARLELEAGSEVSVEVSNVGDRAHNLVIDEAELSTGTLESGAVVTATFTVPDEAATFYCSFHPDMRGRLEPTTG